MKKFLLGIVLFGTVLQNNAQEFNQWSIDFGVGMHDVIFPLSPGYKADSPSFGFADLGVRYMFNDRFGVRAVVGYHEFNNKSSSNEFNSNYYKTSIEGVINAGNLLKFYNWTDKFNFLFHGGVGLSYLRTIKPIDTSGEEMTNFTFGFTPQYKLSNKISLYLDFSAMFHNDQDFTYDGAVNTARKETNVSLSNFSFGVNVALGKKEKHADFWRPKAEENEVINTELQNIKERLDTAEKEISILKTVESGPNKELIMTELDDRYVKKEEIASPRYANTVTGGNVQFIRQLLDKGYVNIYFDVNKATIQSGSTTAVQYIKQFLEDNPYVNGSLTGFADETGKATSNQSLSSKRAKEVFDILVAAGINPSRLSYAGGGEDTTVGKKARMLARKVTFRISQ